MPKVMPKNDNTTNNVLLKLNNVCKVYGSGQYAFEVLKDVNFTINRGEFVVLFGPSGSGKSTLLNLIGGMDVLTSGEILYQNKDLGKFSPYDLTMYRRDELGFVFQFYNLIPTLNAIENVEVKAELVSNAMQPSDALQKVGLADFAAHFPAQLSGGQQQRVSIARGIVANPNLLLCDEPTGALDSEASLSVMDLLTHLHQSLGKTIIMVTHSQELAAYGQKIIEVKDKSAKQITKQQLKKSDV